MKKYLFIFLISVPINIFSQDASLIYQNTVSSTVTIETNNGLGSGFFVGDYIIATCYHVIEDASYAYCYVNNSDYMYEIEKVIGWDKDKDLALLKVANLNRPSIHLSDWQATPGEKVYVIGSPKGLSATISDGIISQLRDFKGVQYIQITAPISPGSSGGPVLNKNGDLIGVSAAYFKEGQNLNFAIPTFYLENLISNSYSSVDYSSSNNSSDYDFDYNKDFSESEFTDYYYSYTEEKKTEIIKKKTKQAFPEIYESFGDMVVVDTKGKIPIVGERCYFVIVEMDDFFLAGFGTVVNVSGNKCTVELIDTAGYLSKEIDFIILFDKDLE